MRENRGLFSELGTALGQWRLAWLFTAADLAEIRRVNKIALTTPFVSVFVQASLLGLVYSVLFGADMTAFLPYVAISLALWQGISIFVTKAGNYNELINQHLSFTDLSPYTIHLAGLIETVIFLLMKIAAALFVILILPQGAHLNANIAWVVLGITLLCVLLFFFGICAAYLLDRVRLLRATLPQLLFFAFLVTPILWQKEQLKHAIWLGDFNPLNHMIEIVRMPLLDGTMPLTSFVVVLACTAGFVGLAALTHHANREMIVFRWIA